MSLNYTRLTFASNGPYVSEYKQTGDVDERGWYIFQWTENQTYFKYLQSYPKGFDDKGHVGVSEKYISHLMKFSQMLRSNHSFSDVMKVAAEVSPSLRYYLLSEFSRRNVGNIPKM